MKILELLASFFQIGLFSIGGGYAAIPLIQEQVVALHGWLSYGEFTDIITISQMTPGPIAVNTSTFVGLRIAGIAGAILATFACILPGCVISLSLAGFFKKHRQSAVVADLIKGLRSASVGLILSAACGIVLTAMLGSSTPDWRGLAPDYAAALLFAVSLFCIRKYRFGTIAIVCLSGAAGLLLYA